MTQEEAEALALGQKAPTALMAGGVALVGLGVWLANNGK